MDKHMPAGVKNSSTFSCFTSTLPVTRKLDHLLEQEWEC